MLDRDYQRDYQQLFCEVTHMLDTLWEFFGDNAGNLTCPEADAICELYDFVGMKQHSLDLLEMHSNRDEPDDQHWANHEHDEEGAQE